jgi:hypothetical protein
MRFGFRRPSPERRERDRRRAGLPVSKAGEPRSDKEIIRGRWGRRTAPRHKLMSTRGTHRVSSRDGGVSRLDAGEGRMATRARGCNSRRLHCAASVCSEVAQLVECPAVNRMVVGSKPTLAAFIRGSSSGRTLALGAKNRGSNPRPRTCSWYPSVYPSRFTSPLLLLCFFTISLSVLNPFFTIVSYTTVKRGQEPTKNHTQEISNV